MDDKGTTQAVDEVREACNRQWRDRGVEHLVLTEPDLASLSVKDHYIRRRDVVAVKTACEAGKAVVYLRGGETVVVDGDAVSVAERLLKPGRLALTPMWRVE